MVEMSLGISYDSEPQKAIELVLGVLDGFRASA